MDVSHSTKLPKDFIESAAANINYWKTVCAVADLPWMIRNDERNLLAAFSFGLKIDQTLPASLELFEMLLPHLEFSRFPRKWINIVEYLNARYQFESIAGLQLKIKLAIAHLKLHLLLGKEKPTQRVVENLAICSDDTEKHEGLILLWIAAANLHFSWAAHEKFADCLTKISVLKNDHALGKEAIVELWRLEAKHSYWAGNFQWSLELLKKADKRLGAKKPSLLKAFVKIEQASLYLQLRKPIQALKQLGRATTLLSYFPPLYADWSRIELLRSIAHCELGETENSASSMLRANSFIADSPQSSNLRAALDKVILFGR